jgi:putative methyltransferase (TIGR04325 family)
MNTAALRVQQIKIASSAVKLFCRLPIGVSVIKRLRSLSLYRKLMGYMRPFDTLKEAHEAVAPFSQRGHENPNNAKLHLDLNVIARGSDYPAMFHIRPALPDVRRVFDVGGNVGNLFYCYGNYLDLSSLVWQVLDLPYNVTEGRMLAQVRGQQNKIVFTEDWSDAAQADLLIVSGSIHYFETPMYEMVAQLERKPSYILINRSPFIEGSEVAVVQEAGSYRVACVLYNRSKMIEGFEKVGYELVDAWKAHELGFKLPGYPEHTVPSYTGLFFRIRSSKPIRRVVGLIVILQAAVQESLFALCA